MILLLSKYKIVNDYIWGPMNRFLLIMKKFSNLICHRIPEKPLK